MGLFDKLKSKFSADSASGQYRDQDEYNAYRQKEIENGNKPLSRAEWSKRKALKSTGQKEKAEEK